MTPCCGGNGFKAAIFVAGHYPLQVVVEELYRAKGDRVSNLRWWGGGIAGLAETVMPEFAARRNLFGHGMMWETSNMRAVGEHLVELERAKKVRTPAFPWPTQLTHATDEALALIAEASAAFGERFYDLTGDYLSRIAAAMSGLASGEPKD